MREHPDRAAIQARQARALRELVAALVPRNPFQTPKLERFARELAEELPEGTEAERILARFSERVPLTVKEEVVADQQAQPPYGTNLTYPLDRYVRYTQTSGTTGAPIRWLDTPESWAWMVENWVHVLEASGVRRGDRIFFAFSFGPFLGFWTAFAAGERMGCLCIPGGGMSSAARAQAILDNQATVLCCTPTYAIRLGEAAAEAGIDLSRSRVRAVVVGGEPGAGIPATRARIEALWPGARLWDHHGMTEIGPVSFECAARPGTLHLLEGSFIAEIIDPDTGTPRPRDAEGELVLTNLGRLGSPLIRYRTGDLVRPSAAVPCACGRFEMALEGGILGRTDDMVVVRGVNLYPTAIEAVVRRFGQVAEYRVEIRTANALPEVTLLLEPRLDCGDPASLAAQVQEALRTTFNLRFPVSIAAPGSLPRFEMKARRWTRIIEPA